MQHVWDGGAAATTWCRFLTLLLAHHRGIAITTLAYTCALQEVLEGRCGYLRKDRLDSGSAPFMPAPVVPCIVSAGFGTCYRLIISLPASG